MDIEILHRALTPELLAAVADTFSKPTCQVQFREPSVAQFAHVLQKTAAKMQAQ